MTKNRIPFFLKKGSLAVVVGSGASGLAAMRLLVSKGFRVRLLEKKAENITDSLKKELVSLNVDLQIGVHIVDQFIDADVVITSPGIPRTTLESLIKEATLIRSQGTPPLIGEMELALYFVKEPIIALTGTSGKTTTVSLIAAMLEAAGKKVFLGGNIGTPLSEYAIGNSCADVIVLECSSFQLQSTPSLKPKVAILLNLSENHLDYHKDMDEYVSAKFNIFSLQDKNDFAIIPPSLLEQYQLREYAATAILFTSSERFKSDYLIGEHNKSNAEAAYQAVLPFGVTEEIAQRAVKAFRPLRHRLEVVGTFGDLIFVNDSKSTTVDSLKVALESFSSPIWLLAGGKFKGGDLHSLRPLLSKKVRGIALYGGSKDFFMKAWDKTAPLSWDQKMDDAIARIRREASAGDVVLLSPATSSFDQFRDYKERGDYFCHLAKSCV